MNKEWKIIPNFSNYMASESGKIKNKTTEYVLEPCVNIYGYQRISLKNDQGKIKSIATHILVALTWIPNPEKKATVNHKNKIKTDNRVENLEWATYKEQNVHKVQFDKENNIKNNIPKRGIWKCDPITKQRIKYYESISQFSMVLKGKARSCSSIALCASGKRNTAYGFFWEYDQKEKPPDKIKDEKWKLYKKINKSIYYISDNGRVKNKNKILKLNNTNNRGYLFVAINNKKHMIHIMVAKKFIQNINNYPMVNHKDGDMKNNHVSNLEWITNRLNAIHAIETGLRKDVKQIIQYDDNDNILNVFKTSVIAGKHFKIHSNSINKYCQGKVISPQFKLKYLESTDDVENKKIDPSTIPINKTDQKKHKVVQYDDNNNILNIFDSLDEAELKLQISRSVIKNCIYGKIEKHIKKNIRVKYLSQSDDLINKKIDSTTIPYQNSTQKSKKIIHQDRKISIYKKESNEFVETLDNMIITGKKYDVSIDSIRKQCQGRVKYSKCKYLFKYHEEIS